MTQIVWIFVFLLRTLQAVWTVHNNCDYINVIPYNCSPDPWALPHCTNGNLARLQTQVSCLTHMYITPVSHHEQTMAYGDTEVPIVSNYLSAGNTNPSCGRHIDDLAQDCSYFIANALELLQALSPRYIALRFGWIIYAILHPVTDIWYYKRITTKTSKKYHCVW